MWEGISPRTIRSRRYDAWLRRLFDIIRQDGVWMDQWIMRGGGRLWEHRSEIIQHPMKWKLNNIARVARVSYEENDEEEVNSDSS